MFFEILGIALAVAVGFAPLFFVINLLLKGEI